MVKPNEERIRTWVYKVWPQRWSEMAPVSDSRAQFLKYAVRDNYPDEELSRIELAIVAQTKHWRAKAKAEGKRLVGIPTLSVWYNQQRYNDEFIDESMVDIKSRTDEKLCQWNDCKRPVHGANFQYCADHQYESIDPWKSKRKETMIRIGMTPEKGESLKEWGLRCRNYLKESKLSIKGSVKGAYGTDSQKTGRTL